MYHYVVMMMIGASVAGATSWGVYTAVSGSAALSRAERAAAAMDGAALAVMASAFSAGGAVSLPAPAADGGLPDWLGVPSRTPWGKPFRYCPYGEGTGGASVAANGYGLGVQTLGGRSYVVSSDAPPVPGTGFVLVSGLPGQDAPGCSSVGFADGVFRVPGGRAVGFPFTALRHLRAGGGTVHVSPDGTGTGGSSADPMSLTDAAAWWKAARPADARFLLSAGTYAQVDFGTERRGGRLTVSGAGATISGNISVPADLSLSGVSVSGSLTVPPGISADIFGGTFGTMQVYGDASLDGGASVGVLTAAAGGRSVLSAASAVTAEARTAGTVSVSGAASSVTNLYADTGGRAAAQNGAVASVPSVGSGGVVCTYVEGTWNCVNG